MEGKGEKERKEKEKKERKGSKWFLSVLSLPGFPLHHEYIPASFIYTLDTSIVVKIKIDVCFHFFLFH